MPSLTPDRWRVLSRYLDEALDMPPDQRAAWLASLGLRDQPLADELTAMLAEHQVVHQSGFMDGRVLDPASTVAPSLEGQVIGAYRLLSPIGQGGTGSVWLAERADGRFQGRAAVKLLNVSLIGRSGEDRFKREGTILARLRHPRIAHLIDAGVSTSGQPYLVLEHVDGQTIDEYCDDRALAVETRVRLFLDVLDAVAHAHANLIVHRDIKPGNVLVSREGQVKLLDFGIAKLVEHNSEWDPSRAAERQPVTREGGRVLTPEFAAPEQLSGGVVTTATDVYALGVLLYVMLTGQHPAGRAVHSPATLIRAIVDVEPPRPSEAVASPPEGTDVLMRHVERCGTTVKRLQRALRGDLDTIVSKALKKDPAERYSSVTALADDLRRLLRHEPISARPDALGYRAARFVRRHAAGVAATAAVVLLIGVLTWIYTSRLSVARDEAERQAAKAVKVSEVLMGLLTSADPFAIRDTTRPFTVRDLLDNGAKQVQSALAGEPELQVDMLTMMGRTYRRLAEYQKARELLEQALASGRQTFGAEHPRVAETLNHLGVMLTETGDTAAAARTLEEALEMRRRLLGAEHPDVAVTLVELGRVYQDQGLNARAEPLHREALRVRQTVLGPEHMETAVSQSDLASVLRLNGDLDGAESLLRQCLETNRKTRGEKHPNTSTTMHDLAVIAAMRRDYAAAESQFRQVLAMQQMAPGPRHPVVATTLNSLARVLMATGRRDEAAEALQGALAVARPALGTDHQLVAIYAINLAAVELARGRPADAESLLREGLRIRAAAVNVVPLRRRTVADDDWSIGRIKSLLGASLVAQARYAEAETVLLAARRDLEAMPSPPARDLTATLSRLVDLYTAWGRPNDARAIRALLAL